MRKCILLLSLILIVILSAAQNVLACDPMNGEPEGDASPSLAYDAASNRYLMTYTKCTGEGRPEIYGKILKHDGTAHGNEFVLSETSNVHYSPRASYNSTNKTFLVVWSDDRNDPDNTYDIYGQIVNADGTLGGSNFVVSDNGNNQYGPVPAYDPESQKFLVVWYDDRNDPMSTYDIYGQFVNPAGTLSGSNFAITSDPASQADPALAYDNYNQRFLVVWDDDRGATVDIYGQLVNPDGTMSGSNFVITDASSSQWVPAVVYDSVNRRFLVSWYDFRNPCADIFAFCANGDIYGQLVNADGTLFNTASATNFVISNGTSEYLLQTVSAAYNTADQQFMVSWSGDDTYSIFGQILYANGDLNSSSLSIADDPSGMQYSPSVAYNSICNNFLIALYTDNFSSANISLETVGTCQASPPTAPVLDSPANGTTGLDTTVVFTWNPSSDPDGDTVTYNIRYCTDDNFTGCDPVDVASLETGQVIYAGIGSLSGFLLTGMFFIGRSKSKKNYVVLLAACLTVSMILVSCSGSGNGSSSSSSVTSSVNLQNHTVTGLNSNTTYYWKVTADDGKGGTTDSETRSFTTK
ncbi:MAG: hypothetical protein C4581_13535 [Nitrospiraceae bacterium]|nr:MAG: hypothetical protein C4581_13535 [Nitrospiraceae bacterium]